jgi:hypothetical protein
MQNTIKTLNRDEMKTVHGGFLGLGKKKEEAPAAPVKTEEPALRDSLDWFSRNAAGDQALRLAVPLAYFWTYEGRVEEARDLLTTILELPSALAQTRIRAKGLYDAGALALRQRDHAASRELNAESLRIYRRLQDKEGAATALLGLSRAALREMDYASVRRYAEESAVLRRDLDDKPGQAAAMHMLGTRCGSTGTAGCCSIRPARSATNMPPPTRPTCMSLIPLESSFTPAQSMTNRRPILRMWPAQRIM